MCGTSVIGLWTVYSGAVNPPSTLSNIFRIFSVILGLALLLQLFLVKQKDNSRTQLSILDYGLLLCVGYFGGLITAWLSVGVGELLVFFSAKLPTRILKLLLALWILVMGLV